MARVKRHQSQKSTFGKQKPATPVHAPVKPKAGQYFSQSAKQKPDKKIQNLQKYDLQKPKEFKADTKKPYRKMTAQQKAPSHDSWQTLSIQKPNLNDGRVLLYGTHAVRAALEAGQRQCVTLYATEAGLARLALALPKDVPVTLLPPEALDALLPKDAVHQGLVLLAGALPDYHLDEVPEDGLLLILDQVTDPHNVGAILRTAAAYGVDALIVTERHSPQFTGVLAKAASGGLDYVKIITVTNLATCLRDLHGMGYSCVGLDSEGAEPLSAVALTRPLALVMGAEGAGLRRLTREHCHHLVRLDVPGRIKSLNVSNAAAISLALIHQRLTQG